MEEGAENSGGMMRADGLVFDKDGTLFSFTQTWSVWAREVLDLLTNGDQIRAAEVAGAIGFNYEAGTFVASSPVVADTPDVITRALHPFFDMDIVVLEAFLNAQAAQTKQAPAVPLVALFEGLKQSGLALGLATNDGEAPARAHLKAAGIIDSFSYIVGYDSGHGGKPMPGQCQGFLDATGLAPDRVAMVGDSLHDLEAGRTAGMQTIGVLTGIASADDLAPLADIILPDIGHLPHWLNTG